MRVIDDSEAVLMGQPSNRCTLPIFLGVDKGSLTLSFTYSYKQNLII